MKLSVIVPNYNHERYLEERLESIFAQDYPLHQVIVIDDASTDGSLAIVEKYRDRIDLVLCNEQNSGSPFPNWQKGLEAASGDAVWIAESDDCASPYLVSTLMPLLQEGAGLAYAQTYDINEEGSQVYDRIQYTEGFAPNIWKDDFRMKGSDFCRAYLGVKNVIPNASAVLFKKSLVQKTTIDSAMLAMRMCGDWLFWLRLLQDTDIAFTARHLNYFRHHRDSSRTHGNYEKLTRRILEELRIRKELWERYSIDQRPYLKRLETRWFELHKLREVGSSKMARFQIYGQFSFWKLRFIRHKAQGFMQQKRGAGTRQ